LNLSIPVVNFSLWEEPIVLVPDWSNHGLKLLGEALRFEAENINYLLKHTTLIYFQNLKEKAAFSAL
jgi:hypothetical protein